MGFWAKSLRIVNLLCGNGKQSVRDIAHKTGYSKSSVHRLKQAMEGRDRHPESWLWETEEGRCWLLRLVVAVLYTFGLKRGVGADTISEFFGHLRLEPHLLPLSLIRHPWRLLDSTPQTSADVERQLHAEVEAIEMLIDTQGLPGKKKALDKVRTQLAGLSALVDLWWRGVWEDVQHVAVKPHAPTSQSALVFSRTFLVQITFPLASRIL